MFVSNHIPKVIYPDRLTQKDLDEIKARIIIGWRLHEDFMQMINEIEQLWKEKENAIGKREE
jgi:hypothetical protein